MRFLYFVSFLLPFLQISVEGFQTTRDVFQKSRRRCYYLNPLHESTSPGPRGDGTSTRRRRTSRGNAGGASDGPKQTQRRTRQRQSEQVAFDGKTVTASQQPNEEANPLDLESKLRNGIKCMTPNISFRDEVTSLPCFTFMSLDDVFGRELGFSERFNSDAQFREDLRMAIRQDIFDTTPFYANLSEKAASILLLPDSSLEGSWKMPESMDRMKHTTKVLKETFGEDTTSPPTGDELFQKIGNLCGSLPSTHWIDIFGVQDRKVSHSWHLDFGKSPNDDTRTVLWGFPPEDDYNGCGVFSHIVPLQKECVAPDDHPRMEPVLFDGTVDEEYIVRPNYEKGKELLMYRDIDVLHSAPDVVYRTSVMRFM